MKKTIYIGGTGIIILFSAWLLRSRAVLEYQLLPHIEPVTVSQLLERHPDAVAPMPTQLFSSDAMEVSASARGGEVRVLRSERALDASDPKGWIRYDSSDIYSTAYEPTAVCGRTSHEIVVGGHAKNGDAVVELWTFTVPKGAYFADRPRASTPVGTAIAPAGLVGDIQGALGFVPPAQRQSSPVPARRELYRGAQIAGVHLVAVDPEGRFALIVSGDDRLFQLTISAQPVLTELYSKVQVPALANRSSMRARQDATFGRLYVLPSGEDLVSEYLIFQDADNDGVFESNQAYDGPGFQTWHTTPWLDNYMNYKFMP